jgi:hypothetical protein
MDHVYVNVYARDAAFPMFHVTMKPDYGGPFDMETTLIWWGKLVRKDRTPFWDMHSGRRRVWSLREIAAYMPRIMDRYNEMMADG